MKLIIPSATIVSEELQKIGKLPAVIYPVNEKIVFDYLLDQYNQVCNSIDILCFQNASKVHRRLSTYEREKIHVVDIPQLGDLGLTIYYGLEDYSGEIIINFADTIVADDLPSTMKDAFFYSTDLVNSNWTYYEMEQGLLTTILDKPSEGIKGEKSLFVGVFKLSDAKKFKECLEIAFTVADRSMNSFYYALMLYSKVYKLQEVYAKDWFDIGHADKYFDSQLEVKSRVFNHIEIDKNRGILRKTSDDVDKFIGEIKWYLKLPSDVEYVRPRIFSYSLSFDRPYVEMEYYAYHTIHELFVYGDLTKQQWITIFKRIRFVLNDFARYKMKDSAMQESINAIYLHKTIQRLEQLKKFEDFTCFYDQSIVVNGTKYISLNEVMNKLKVIIPQILLDVDQFTIIHGDLCFANMIIDNNMTFVKLIDPRGKFGKYDIYGDCRYEYAKLFHSMDGKYDFIIKDLFELEYSQDNVEIIYKIKDRQRNYDVYELFLSVFQDEIRDDIEKITLIQSLLFLSMVPLHKESVNRQLVMLATGLEILDRVVDIKL